MNTYTWEQVSTIIDLDVDDLTALLGGGGMVEAGTRMVRRRPDGSCCVHTLTDDEADITEDGLVTEQGLDLLIRAYEAKRAREGCAVSMTTAILEGYQLALVDPKGNVVDSIEVGGFDPAPGQSHPRHMLCDKILTMVRLAQATKRQPGKAERAPRS